jgi:PHD/YefM family antitoxin component YafN of YafNO toxin-antitoxin module
MGNVRDLLDRQRVELGPEHDRRAGCRAFEHRRDAVAAQARDDPVGPGCLERAPHGPSGRRLLPRELGLAMPGASPGDELGEVGVGQEHGRSPSGSVAERPIDAIRPVALRRLGTPVAAWLPSPSRKLGLRDGRPEAPPCCCPALPMCVTCMRYIGRAGMPEITSREFAAEPLKVKQLARTGPVVVTNRGQPELVIVRYERWRALVPQEVPEDLLEALGNEGADEIDLAAPRAEVTPRPVDLDDR